MLLSPMTHVKFRNAYVALSILGIKGHVYIIEFNELQTHIQEIQTIEFVLSLCTTSILQYKLDKYFWNRVIVVGWWLVHAIKRTVECKKYLKIYFFLLQY